MIVDPREFDQIIISLSGGKDSQAVITEIAPELHTKECVHKTTILNVETGNEWPESWPHVQFLAKTFGINAIQITASETIIQMVSRKKQWPNYFCRFCLSCVKRKTYEGWLRSLPEKKILHITGERREESRSRSLLPAIAREPRTSTRGKTVTRLRPVLDYKLADVWAVINQSGLDHHKAYKAGCKRVSCVCCPIAHNDDLVISCRENPEFTEAYLRAESEIDQPFKKKSTLRQLLAK